MKLCIALLTCFFLPSFAANLAQPVVKTTKGSVRGVSIFGASVFLGIPYAQPPIEKLRFQPPQESKSWTSTRNATAFKKHCASAANNHSLGMDAISEDCLYLNVFTPNVSASLPVMVWIHGGCYTSGGSMDFPIQGTVTNLVARQVVVVSIDYRLGIFGFLTTKTSELPSNLGIQDMVRALHWVKSEIGAFGGNASEVTIFGESAGAAATNLLTYAPAAKGLFKAAISQSGVTVHPALLDGALGVYNHQSQESVLSSKCITQGQWDKRQFNGLRDCLGKMSTADIVALGGVPYQMHPVSHTCYWIPVMDPSGTILPDWPRNLASKRSKKMPILLGTNHDEMIRLLTGPTQGAPPPSEALFDLAAAFYITDNFPPQFLPEIMAAIRMVYNVSALRAANNAQYWYKTILQLAGDATFFQSTNREVDFLANTTAKVFLYSFDYVSQTFPWQHGIYHGVYHFMDCFYLFNFTHKGNITWQKSPLDEAMVETFGRLWTNFAKSGDPNIPSLGSGDHWNVSRKSSNGHTFISLLPVPRMSKQSYEPASRWLFEVFLPSLTGWIGPILPPNATMATATAAPAESAPSNNLAFIYASFGVLGLALLALIAALIAFLFRRC